MKTLYIVRHAKSSWSDSSLSDFDRGLKKRGKEDIELMAKWLMGRGVKLDLVLSSPAKRARKSLKVIKKELNLNASIIKFDERIYEASLDELLEVIISIDNGKEKVLLLGHNPSLNEVVTFLSGKFIDNIPTSGVVEMQFDIKRWEELGKKKGKITAFEYPKKLKVVK